MEKMQVFDDHAARSMSKVICQARTILFHVIFQSPICSPFEIDVVQGLTSGKTYGNVFHRHPAYVTPKGSILIPLRFGDMFAMTAGLISLSCAPPHAAVGFSSSP